MKVSCVDDNGISFPVNSHRITLEPPVLSPHKEIEPGEGCPIHMGLANNIITFQTLGKGPLELWGGEGDRERNEKQIEKAVR